MKTSNLKALIISLIICWLYSPKVLGQITIEQYTAQYDSLKPFVKSGILLDRCPHALWAANADFNPYYFKPNLDTACSSRIFRDLYSLFYYADYQNEFFI